MTVYLLMFKTTQLSNTSEFYVHYKCTIGLTVAAG